MNPMRSFLPAARYFRGLFPAARYFSGLFPAARYFHGLFPATRYFRGLFPAAFLFLALGWLAACTTNPATGRQSFTAFMSRADEIEVGRREHPKILKEFGGRYKDRRLGDYVRNVGLGLARVSEASGPPFIFTVLNDSKVNAFALPGGYVYITRGLLAIAENEAEMAGVLAHEIGHVAARHTAERYSQAMAANIGLGLLGILGSAAGAPAATGNLMSLGAQAVLQGYSRDQELEADLLAVRYLARAGYDTNALTSFFYKMRADDRIETAISGNGPGDKFNIMAGHPRTAERINQAIRLARATPMADPKVGRDIYLDRIDGLLFGDDPEQGIVRGRVFAHPQLRVSFKVPPGFVISNTPSRVVARDKSGSMVVFDMAGGKAARAVRDLRRYLVDQWGKNISLKDVERIDINGMEAATGRGKIRQGGGWKNVRLVAIRERPERIYRFLFATAPRMTGQLQTELQRTTYSFRRLSEKEALELKPLRIKVVRVGPSDSARTFIDAMPLERLKGQWFRLLNGLVPGSRKQKLEIGQRVKTIVD